MNELIDSYIQFLKDNITLKQVGEYTAITTPFMDRHNDCIELYVKENKKDEIYITDDGYTIDDLADSGFRFNTVKRKKILEDILKSYHLQIKNNELFTITSPQRFACSKHFFIQAILAINDLYTISKSNVSSLFFEDVATFFDDNDILYNQDIKITGKSGLDHNINYVLPAYKKNKIPERYIQVINNSTKSNTQSNIFLWQDLKNSRKRDNKMYILINNIDNSVKEEYIQAYKNYNISTLLWSEKDNIVNQLKLEA